MATLSLLQIIRRVLEPRYGAGFIDEERPLPLHLHIVIPEGRPKLHGVKTAQTLVVEVNKAVAERTRTLRRHSDPFSTLSTPFASHDLAPGEVRNLSKTMADIAKYVIPVWRQLWPMSDGRCTRWGTAGVADPASFWKDPSKLRPYSLHSPGQAPLAAAYALLAEEPLEGKVTIEIVTDAALSVRGS